MKKPTCFISYSWDSISHKKWVARFVKKLSSFGIIPIFDQSADLIMENMPTFMQKLVEADYIAAICTPQYYQKVNNGAAFEKMLLGGEVLKTPFSKKFLVILAAGSIDTSIPIFLRPLNYIDMSNHTINNRKMEQIAAKMKEIHSKVRVPNQSSFSKLKKTKEGEFMKKHPFAIHGFTLLGGRGIDGIKYIWKKDNHYVESLAFNKRLKSFKSSVENDKISAYTLSVSHGCILNASASQCSFCATGGGPFEGFLSSDEIALQSIFMAEYDSNCPSWPQVRENSREFAFMGQGEPGFCYPQIRNAILLTDHAMDEIKNNISRYVISTCGVSDFMPLFISDIKNNIFKNKITIHFSLHAIDEDRNELMPVNKEYNYKNFIQQCNLLFDITGDKIGIGLLMFNNFRKARQRTGGFTLTEERLYHILKQLDKNIFRIDLCDFNTAKGIGVQDEPSNEMANHLLSIVQSAGFEGKLFSSFGCESDAGCGMLSSKITGIQKPGHTTLEHYTNSLILLDKAKSCLKM